MSTAYSSYVSLGNIKNTGVNPWISGTVRAWFDYTQSATSSAVTVSVGNCGAQIGSFAECKANDNYSFYSLVVTGARALRSGSVLKNLAPTSANVQIWKRSKSDANGNPYYNGGASKSIGSLGSSFSVSRTHTAQTIALAVDVYVRTELDLGWDDVPWDFSDGTAIRATVNITVPARESYTVSYNSQGGSAVASQTKWWGESLTLSTARPTRLGYVFKGWATSPAGAVAYQPGSAYTSNAALALYAVWEPVYTVKYDLNGLAGATGRPENQTKSHGVDLALSTMVPESNSVVYTFLGWGTHSGAVAPTYQPGDTYSSNENLTLYAVWRKNVDSMIALPKVNRVHPSPSDIIDDTSEYVRVSAQVSVSSIWKTRTRISITSQRSDGEAGPSAATIYPSGALEKGADVSAAIELVIWRSYLDDLKFSAEHQYTVRIQADTYRIFPEVESGTYTLPDQFPERVYLDSPKTTVVSASDVQKGYSLIPRRFEPPEDQWQGCALWAEQTVRELDNGDREVTVSCPDNTGIPAYVWESSRVTVEYQPPSEDPGGDFTITTPIPKTISVEIEDFPETIPYSSDNTPLVYTAKIPDLPEGSTIRSVTLNSKHGSAMFLNWPIRAVAEMTHDNETITVSLSYPDSSSVFANVPDEFNTLGIAGEGEELVYTSSATALLTSAEFIMDFHRDGHGAAIGRHAPAEGLDIGWKTKFFEAVELAKELVVKAKATVAGLLVEGKSDMGDIALSQGTNPRITRAGSSMSWVSGHKYASPLTLTTAPDDGTYSGVLSARTASGNWGLGVLRENLALSYIKLDDLNAGNNSSVVAYLRPPTGQTPNLVGMSYADKPYWGLLDPDGSESTFIRTTGNGFIPHAADTSAGSSYVGTSSWPFKEMHTKYISAPTIANVAKLNGKEIIQYVRDCIPGYVITGWNVVTLTSGTLAAGAAGSAVSATWTVPSGTTHVSGAILATSMAASWNSTAFSLSGTTGKVTATPRRAYGAGSGTVAARFLVIGICAS